MKQPMIAAAALAVIATVAACAPTAITPPTVSLPDITFPPPGASSLGDYTGKPPLFVQDYVYSRDDGQQTWSVRCVAHVAPENSQAGHYIDVQVSEQGPDGPDGQWNQGRPCPRGPILYEEGTL